MKRNLPTIILTAVISLLLIFIIVFTSPKADNYEPTAPIEYKPIIPPQHHFKSLEEIAAENETVESSAETQEQVYKTNDEIAQEVIHGLWGNGVERRERITEAGYDYEAIQAIVTELCPKPVIKARTPSSKTTAPTNEVTSSGSYLGTFKITGYGAFEGSVGTQSASGLGLIPWGTCAMNNARRKELGLRYGDIIVVEGIGALKITDCGCSYGTIDVFVNSRSEAYALTSHRNVYRGQ